MYVDVFATLQGGGRKHGAVALQPSKAACGVNSNSADLLATRLWLQNLTLQNISFFICKMGTIYLTF